MNTFMRVALVANLGGLVVGGTPAAAQMRYVPPPGAVVSTPDRGSAPTAAATPRAEAMIQARTERTDRVSTMPSVTMTISNMARGKAIQAVAAAVGFDVVYSENVVRLDGTVTHRFVDTPLDEAIRAILRGTKVTSEVVTSTKSILLSATGTAARGADSLGVLRGTILDSVTRRPISSVAVVVQGKNARALSDERGTFTIAGLAAGKYSVTVRRLGYTPSVRTVQIARGAEIVLTVALAPSASMLTEVVTTGAGEQERYRVGNGISSINADSIVPTTPIRNLSDLLRSRATGVDVASTSGTVGSGSRIRIRGISSLLATSDPIVIVDGVRVDAAYSTGGVSHNVFSKNVPATSRLDDIDPNAIETIDVLKGPAASTLYGSDAANGVIVIKTKRGQAGPTRWTFSTTQGTTSMHATFPESWRGHGLYLGGLSAFGCNRLYTVRNLCTLDSVTHYNPLNDPSTSPLKTGRSSMYGVQVSGGTTRLQYFLGGTYNDDLGLLEIPAFDAERVLEQQNGKALPDWMVHPNVLSRLNATSRLTAQLTDLLDVSLSSGFVHQYHRDAPQGGTLGIVYGGINGPGYRDTINYGWSATGSPARMFATRTSDAVERVTASGTANWRPLAYLSGHTTVGADLTLRRDEMLLRQDEFSALQGQRGRQESTTQVRTVDVGSTLETPFLTGVRLRTTVGGQYTYTISSNLNASASNLAFGSGTINGAGTVWATEYSQSNATAGWYVDEQVGVNGRLFVTAAVRGDVGSAFGRDAKTALFPKWSASWLVSQEPFFPHLPAIGNLRLRAAFGHAGVQPTMDARFRTYGAENGFANGNAMTVVAVRTIGNQNLRPERSVELEGGFDLSMWNERFTMEGTLYRKRTRDALVSRTLPLSLGVTSRQENIGELENRGTEFSVSARPIESTVLDWNVRVGYSRNRNVLVTLGPTTMPPVGTTRYVPGYPVDGFWDRPIMGYADVNGNGMIEPEELKYADSVVYMGTPSPKGDFTFDNSLSLFSGRLTVHAGFQYRGTATQNNTILQTQCLLSTCRGAVDPHASVAEQVLAAAQGLPLNPAGFTGFNYSPFLERVSSLRFSELSITMIAPRALLRVTRAHNATLSIMGRNLGLWSHYRGADPEVNTVVDGNQMVDDGGIPQTRDWSLRVNLSY